MSILVMKEAKRPCIIICTQICCQYFEVCVKVRFSYTNVIYYSTILKKLLD
jgi:hypothetical protein